MTKADMDLKAYFANKRILVTGGAGFIGSHLVEMLVPMGATITVPVRKTTNLRHLESVRKDVRIVEAYLTERNAVDVVMKGQEVVLHLAAAKGGGIAHSMQHHGSLFRDNLLSSLTVLDAARSAGVGRYLAVSSACVYPRDAVSPTPEEEGLRDAPEPTNAGYGWSKRMQEYATLAYAEEFAMNVGIARPFNAYGPRDDFFQPTNHVIPGLITRVMSGENPLVVWGTGTQTRAFLYVTDFARGLLTTAASGARGPLNIGSDEETSIRDLAAAIVEVSGANCELRFDTSKPDGQPRRACDTRRARAEIGFQAQVPLKEGLRQTVEWYRRECRSRGVAIAVK